MNVDRTPTGKMNAVSQPAPTPDLSSVAADIEWPDHDAERQARERHRALIKPAGSLGKLEALSVWVSGVQGQCPPDDFVRPRVIVFAGDHGIAAAGMSAYPVGVTAQMVANVVNGGAAVNSLAELAGATVRVVDLAVDANTPAAISGHKIRRTSGRIDREDALSADEGRAAVAAGIAIADEEIDAGADLLVVGAIGIANTTPAAVLISVLTNTEPIKVVGRDTTIDDDRWMRKATAVRDARLRAWPHRADPMQLLTVAGGADLAAMAGFLLRAAARRTPVLLDGLVVSAAAVVVHEEAPRAMRWWQAGQVSPEPAHAIALTQLGLEPILDLQISLGEGSGALVALLVLRAAVRTLAEMATFEEAGVNDGSPGM